MCSRYSTIILLLAQCALLVRASGRALQPRASAAPNPVSIAPSQNWDGVDGPWSSFTIQIGTPIQDVRVFISSGNAATWVVIPGGCNAGDTNCLNNRGTIFNPNTSSTWSEHGNFELSTEQNLNLSAVATFGNDTLGLGIQGSGGPVLQDQVIGGYTSDNFYLGFFGVNSAPINFGGQTQTSYLATLFNQKLIPSIAFGYTAGNQYRLKQVLGSLTLGGYDASRFVPNALTFPLAADSSRSLMVGIQSISSVSGKGPSTSLLTQGIMSYVDSTVPEIWLPLEAYQAFEKAFTLTFDETSGLYLVNSSLHTQLQNQNASITFTLGAGISGGQTIDITLPYASFDLLVGPPTPGVANSTRYFPLRRAANDSQYTLGRTFLQESYLIVDWQRRNFSMSQCAFTDNMQENLVPIMSTALSGSSSSGSSSTGKTAGIAVGVVGAVLIVAGIVGAIFWRKHQKTSKYQPATDREDTPPEETIRQGFGKGELSTDHEYQRFEMAGSEPKPKPFVPVGGWVDEKARYPGDRSNMAEVEGGDVSSAELGPSQRFQRQGLHEMPDPSVPEPPPVELLASIPSSNELEGSNPISMTPPPRQRSVRSQFSKPSSPSSPSSMKRRSFKDRFSSGRSRPSGTSTQKSIPSMASGPQPPPRPSRGPSSPPSTEAFFSPVSRKGTGTFSSDDEEGPSSPRGNPILSPVSPSSPQATRGMFERLRGPNRQG